MKVIGAIIGWLFGLLFAVIMYVSVLVIIPISVFGEELLNRDSATRLINAIVEDDAVMTRFVDGILEGMAQSDSSGNPAMAELFAQAGDETTDLGKATRNVLDTETISSNLVNNADAFYDWLEGKTDLLSLNLTIGGTPEDHVTLASAYIEAQLDSMPACTESELADMLISGVDVATDLTCNPGISQVASYDEMATALLDDVKVRTYLREGFPMDISVGNSERDALKILQKISGAGIIAAWVIVGISVLFMLILFSPKGVRQMMTGLVVAVTGFSLSSMGGGALTLITKQAGIDGVESVARAFIEVIGKPIATQGNYMMALGALLFVWGILILIKKKTSTEVSEPVVVATPVESAMEIAEDVNSKEAVVTSSFDTKKESVEINAEENSAKKEPVSNS